MRFGNSIPISVDHPMDLDETLIGDNRLVDMALSETLVRILRPLPPN